MLLPFSTYTKPLGKDSDFIISFNSTEMFYFLFQIVARVFIDLTIFIYQYSWWFAWCCGLGCRWIWRQMLRQQRKNMRDCNWLQANSLQTLAWTSLFVWFSVIIWPSFKFIFSEMLSTYSWFCIRVQLLRGICFNSFLPQYWHYISFCGNLSSATDSDFLLDL